jgi:hypothetical protein
MKLNNIYLVTKVSAFTLFLSQLTIGQAQSPEVIEANITHTFIPKTGYDTNDDVHFVAEGVLPNSCYSLLKAKAQFKRVSQSDGSYQRVFEYRQFAQKEQSKRCSDEELKKPENAHLAYPRPIPPVEIFLPEVNSEKENQELYTGPYHIQSFSNGKPSLREFFVERPATPQRKDNIDYAPVLDVTVPLEVKIGDPVSIQVGAWLSNSCQKLEDSDLNYKLVDDVIVVKPVLRGTMGDGLLCLQVMSFKSATLTVKDLLETGRYLVHTRSRDGKGWNNPFSVSL